MDLEAWMKAHKDELADIDSAFMFYSDEQMITALLNAGLNEYVGYAQFARMMEANRGC